MKNKFESAILEYEKARQAVSKISEERRALIYECERVKENFQADICLVDAHKNLMDCIEEDGNCWGGHGYTYDEVLSIGDANGKEYCKPCKDSYKIKKGPLAEAKQIFGKTKTRLARLGKELIAGESP